MPLYEYECEACGERFEVIQKFSDAPPDSCEKCGKGPVHRQLSSPAIQFKGSGWYITDYARKDKSSSGGGSTGTSEKAESKSESKTESKTDSKSDSKSDAKSSATPASTTASSETKK
jgi:putative FmdB family regulatory protein